MDDAQYDRLHHKIDFYTTEVDRFHAEVADLTRQIANCDKLVKIANASIGQIDQKIAAAAQVGAQARQIVDSAGVTAAAAATAAATSAVDELIDAMTEATQAARNTGRSLNVLQFKTGGWIAIYATLTVLCCLATAFIASWALRGNALTPEQAHYVELGKAHEALLNNASDRELKQITAIRNRPSKNK
jgi:predicted metal-binding membrane protein